MGSGASPGQTLCVWVPDCARWGRECHNLRGRPSRTLGQGAAGFAHAAGWSSSIRRAILSHSECLVLYSGRVCDASGSLRPCVRSIEWCALRTDTADRTDKALYSADLFSPPPVARLGASVGPWQTVSSSLWQLASVLHRIALFFVCDSSYPTLPFHTCSVC